MPTFRVEALTRGMGAIRDIRLREERRQGLVPGEMRELQNVSKKPEFPEIGVQISSLAAGLVAMPDSISMQDISKDLSCVALVVFGFTLALLTAVIGAARSLKKIGVH